MTIDFTVSHRCIAAVREISSRLLIGGLCAMGMAVAATAREPLIITIDAPGAGVLQGQGTGCFAYTDCSVLINDAGVITGYYLDANNAFHGFVRSPEGRFTTLDAPGADTKTGDFNGTFPNGINDSGAITGLLYDANNESHGFLRSPQGKYTIFDVSGGTSGTTTPVALNAEAAIVGYYLDQNGVFEAFLRRPDGSIKTWSGPEACAATPATGCYGTAAFGINAWGTVAGGYEDNGGNFVQHGLIRTPDGKFKTFEAVGAGTGPYQGTGSPGSSVPVNRSGVIAGYYADGSGVFHGYLRSPWGDTTTFDVPGTGPQGINCYNDCSLGLNDRGAISGYYLDANNVSHGYVRSPEGRVKTFDAPGADTKGAYRGTFPVSINNRGAVTGYYVDANGVNHGFLLLPPDSD